MKIVFPVISIIFAIATFVGAITKQVNFTQECGGYLKRATNANTVELAVYNLEKAILYLENNGITTGYTSVLWKTPDEDVEYWYKNLKSAYNELKSLPTDNKLLCDNALMKLKETLIDNTKDGDRLVVPNGISRYPNNKSWAIFIILASFALFCAIIDIYI